MKRQQLLFLTFLALFIFSSTIIIPPHTNDVFWDQNLVTESSEDIQTIPLFAPAPEAPPVPAGPSWDGDEYLYQGLGQVLNTIEHTKGNKSAAITNLDYPSSQSSQINIPQSWTAYQLEASVNNLYDNITHIEGSIGNGNFESGSGTLPTNWGWSQNGLGDNSTGPTRYYHDWGSSYQSSLSSGTYGASVVVDIQSGFTWNLNEYFGLSHTVNLNRDDVIWAKLSFDVRFYNIAGNYQDYDEIAVYVEVGGIPYIFVCAHYCPEGAGWYNIKFSLPLDDVQSWSASSIDVILGMGINFDYDVVTATWGLDFDNVMLTVKGKATPTHSALQLQVNSTSSWTNTNYGTGTILLTGTWGPYGVNRYIYAIWTTGSSRSKDVSFDYTLTLYIKRSKTTEAQTGPEGTAFSVKQGASVYWTAWFFAPFYSTYYASYNYTVKKPTTETWTLFEVIDPNLEDKTVAVTSASNSTYWCLPSTLVTGFGWWKLTFTSTNRITSISGLQSSYNIGDTLSVTVNHNTVTSGQCNITIYDRNQQVVHEEAKSLTGSTQVSFNKLFDSGDTFAAGPYTLCATYDNGATTAMTRAGFYSVPFAIIHDTDLSIESGAASKTVYYGGGTFFVRLTYDDLDKSVNPWVTNTTGTVQINGTVNGHFIIFREFGNLYQAEISNALLTPQNYLFTVSADDPYHNSATDSITLLVRSDATLSSPESPGLTMPYDESFTVQVFYEDELSAGISGATVTTNWPTAPTGSGNGTAGWYNIIFDTADQPGPDTYSVTIQAQRNYYTTRTVVLTIVVREITTTIDYTSPGSIPWDEDVEIDFDFFANDADSTTHDEDPITSASFTFQLDGGGLSQGADYTLTNHLDGTYTITLLASSGKISTIKTGYELTIQGNPTNTIYGNATRRISFNVRSLNTIIMYTPPAPQPWGNDVVITLNFTVDDPASTTHNGDNIPGLLSGDVSVTLDGVPLGSFGWSPFGDGRYNLTIYSSSISAVKIYNLIVSVTHSSAHYKSAVRALSFQVLAHQTQVIVDQPDPTPFGQQTSVTITWRDLVTATDLTDTQLNYLALEFTNGTGLPNEPSLSFLLDTSAWNPGSYQIVVSAIPTSNQYLESSGTLRITILIHQTAVTVLPPEATPWGQTTDITIQWFDLTAGGEIDVSEAYRIVISGAVSATITTPSSWTITIDTSSLGLGPHALTITVEAKTGPRIYADSSGNVNVIIRSHRVYVLVTGPAPVPEDGSFELSVSWTDLDTGLPIDNGTYLLEIRVTQISGPTAPTLPWSEFSNLEFIIDATGWDRGTHRLNVTVYANSANFATGFGTVNVIIRVHSINADVDPIPRVPYGNDILITLRVNDSDLIPPAGLPENQIASIIITGGPSTITLDSSNWALWVSNGTAGDGIYQVTLDVSSWNLGTYILQFNVYTSSEYGNGVVITQITIRALATSFTYQSPPVVAWSENGKLIVTYLVSDPVASQDGDPIAPPSITITILYGATPLTRYTHFDWVYWQNGKYNITIFNSFLTSVQPYQFDITISKGAQYANGQLDDVPLTVRSLFTWLHPTAVPLTPYSDDVIIEVEYMVLDGESSLNGLPIHTGTESITVIGLDGFNPTLVTWQWIGASSIYRITIDASEVPLIQSYKIMISISGAGNGYEPDVIPELTFTVRTVFTAMIIEPVDAQPYLENFTIYITYKVNDPDSSNNNEGIVGEASIIKLLEYPGLYTVIEIGFGVYEIVINSTGLGAPSSYIATIKTDWTQSPPPYTIQTKQVTLIVTTRTTSIRNTVTGEYGYLDNIIVNFTYSDFLRSEWITNTSYGGNHVRLVLYNVTSGLPIPTDAWDVLSITSGTDAFQLRIQADYFGQVNKFFDFRAVVSWQLGTAPYFVSKQFEFRAYVVGQRTDVIVQPSTGPTPIGTNILITFRFITEQGKGINETQWPLIDLTLLCEQLPSFGVKTLDWDYTFLGNGEYQIWVNTTRLGDIGSYTFFLNVTYPKEQPPFFESQTNEPIPRIVRYINTLLDYVDPGSLYAGDDLNLTVRYYDLDNHHHILPPIDFQITSGMVVSISQLPSQWWEIIIDTAGLPAGADFTLWIFANKSFHVWQNISAPVYIYAVPLEITLESLGVIESYYGEMPFEIINVTIRIGAGALQGTLVTDAVVQAFWDQPTLTFINENNGIYWLEISSLYKKDRYPIEIIASKVGYYSNYSIFITYTITAGPSQLIPPFGTSQIVYIGNLYNITVIYQTPFGDPLRPSGGAVVTYSSLDLGVDNVPMSEISPGVYQVILSSATYLRGIITISVKATFPNVESGTQFFTLDVRETPAELQIDNIIIGAFYDTQFTINVTLLQTLNSTPIAGQIIEALWQGNVYTLIDVGGGNYTFTFWANLTAGRTYDLPLDLINPSLDCDTLTLQISIAKRLMQGIELIDAWTYYPGAENTTVSLFDPQAPLGDMFYLLFSYIDYKGISVPGGGGTATIGTTPISLEYNDGYGGYLLSFNTSQFGIETFNVIVTIGKDNYVDQVTQFTITLRRINIGIHLIEIIGNVTSTIAYVNEPLVLLVYLEDTDHNWGVTNANWTIPAGWEVEPVVDMGPGYYRIIGIERQPTVRFIDIQATKNRPFDHSTARLPMTFEFRFNPTVQLLINVGTVSAIILIIALVGWILWARVYSIPWEVRRMRKLAKAIEKDEGYSLSKKDQKRFHEKGIVLEEKVDSAMSTIGIAATPAMIPAIEEVEEVTATEEDIMAELDKIPGLGPEEKKVLSEEMRKIPRKDRIWFLDDLRRQMGQRRMDFLTKREEAPPSVKPEPKPAAKPVKKPVKKPEVEPPVEPLEKVKAVEPPPPEKALKGDRTAPTVLPPEERVIARVPSGVELEIRRELDKIPGLSEDEKQALVDHLKYLSKEERQATYFSLKQSANED